MCAHEPGGEGSTYNISVHLVGWRGCSDRLRCVSFAIAAIPVRMDTRTFVLVLLAFFLSVVCASRALPETPDLVRYRYIYDTLTNTQPFLGRFEPGYVLSMLVAKFVYRVRFDTFLFSFTAISLLLKFAAFVRLTRSALLASLTYTFLLFYQTEFTAMREAMAIGFAYLAIADASVGNYRRASVLFFVATMFHYSIAVLAASTAFFLLAWKWPRPVIALTAIVALTVFAEWPAIAKFVIGHAGSQLSGEISGVAKESFEAMFTLPRLAFFASVFSIPAFTKPWADRSNALLFFLGLVGAGVAIALSGVPVIGVRLLELFEMAPVLLALRAPINSLRIVPALGFGLTAAWTSLPTWLSTFGVG